MSPFRFPLPVTSQSFSMKDMDLPKNKSAQAAEHIKKLIEVGHFSTTLPSERQLADQLLVSRNCVRDALEILTNEKVLAPSEPSKRRQILIDSETPSQQKIERCIIITPTPEHKAPSKLLVQVAKLRNLLAPSHVDVSIRSPRAFRRKDPSDELCQIVEENPNTVWVLHQCPESFQLWFQAAQLPTLVFGTIFPSVNLPSIDSDHTATARHAAGQLIRLGHKHISLVIPRTTLAGAQNAEVGIQQAIEQTQHEVSSTILRHDFNVPRLTTALDKVYRSATPPTAFIIQNHHHFLTVYSHLLSLGLKIPQHVSLISMVDDHSFEYLTPTPASYSTQDKLVKSLAASILGIYQKKKLSACIVPQFQPGQSVSNSYQ
ncbi:substrate-binding domain-containing protein [Rubritalea tangerina]|uniref:Substrate-binding domain-containing protein n=2 Tax=Rubritalea tangerina TaxID=430798 RepID=A0ABW4Z6Z5_9BACT